MAKVGYIFKANHYDSYEADKEWMLKFGCVQVIEEETDHELMRPQWKQLMNALDRGDELVVSKFSNAVRGVRELAVCIEMCRIKVVRLISIHDRIDSRNELFKETTAAEVLEMIGALPEEIAALRKSSSHIMLLQKNIKSPAKTVKTLSRTERERTIVDMYNAGYSMDDIANVSGFSSRSSIFRILNKYNVDLNRGRTKGPRRKKGDRRCRVSNIIPNYMELSDWFKGFEKGIAKLTEGQRETFFHECGKNCVQCGTLQIYKDLYEQAAGDLDLFFL